ncbi:MAG: hypothetical protein ACOYJG_09160 [Prevotella sp.]
MMKRKYLTPTIEMLEQDLEFDILGESKNSAGSGVGSKESSFDFEEQTQTGTEDGSYDWSK